MQIPHKHNGLKKNWYTIKMIKLKFKKNSSKRHMQFNNVKRKNCKIKQFIFLLSASYLLLLHTFLGRFPLKSFVCQLDIFIHY